MSVKGGWCGKRKVGREGGRKRGREGRKEGGWEGDFGDGHPAGCLIPKKIST
jgi:hypothetical protein